MNGWSFNSSIHFGVAEELRTSLKVVFESETVCRQDGDDLDKTAVLCKKNKQSLCIDKKHTACQNTVKENIISQSTLLKGD